MALPALRLRRAVSLSSFIIKQRGLSYAIPSISTLPSSSLATFNNRNPSLDIFQSRLVHLPFQSRHFRSSSASLSSARSSFRDNNTSEEIGPDTILFEGCDYNHWLITMDFPKDPAPTREEMIETYLQTLAKVVGSYEEAKRRMYAFSTTTYQGFQCLVSEEMSEKFRGLPGVVFILPDSYIDPVNKEYGGDKYENGVITPRPPPIQYQRRGGRYNDRNRDFNRNRERGPMQNQQGNPGYVNQGPADGGNRNFGQYNYQVPNQQSNPVHVNQGPMHGDARNLGPNQTTSVQPNYGPGVGGDRRDPMPMTNTPGVRDSVPYNQGNYNQNQQGYYNPQGGRVPPESRVYAENNRTRAPSQGAMQGQGVGGNYGYGQGSDGNYGQMPWGNNGHGTAGNYGQGFNYQQNHPGHGGEPQFSPMEQRNNVPGGQQNYGQMGQPGPDQGRY